MGFVVLGQLAPGLSRPFYDVSVRQLVGLPLASFKPFLAVGPLP